VAKCSKSRSLMESMADVSWLFLLAGNFSELSALIMLLRCAMHLEIAKFCSSGIILLNYRSSRTMLCLCTNISSWIDVVSTDVESISSSFYGERRSNLPSISDRCSVIDMKKRGSSFSECITIWRFTVRLYSASGKLGSWNQSWVKRIVVLTNREASLVQDDP
jgi:hypothetical protein